MKKILSVLLTVCLLAVCLPVDASAATVVASGRCGDRVTWTITSDGTLTIGGTGAMYDYGTEADGRSPWVGKSETGISRVVFESGVTRIGKCAFYQHGLTEVVIPSTIKEMETSAFTNCFQLKTAKIYADMTDLPRGTFAGCHKLERLYLSASIDTLRINSLRDCYGLLHIYTYGNWSEIAIDYGVDLNSPAYEGKPHALRQAVKHTLTGTPADDYSLPPGPDTPPSGDFIIMNGVLLEYTGAGGAVTIPDGVTGIGARAFEGCTGLTSVTIPDGVTNIEDFAFSGCTGLKRVTIPGSVANVGLSVFSGCTGLTSAGPKGGGYAYEFGWTEKIPEHAFALCTGLTSVTIPNGVTGIGRYAFEDCTGLKSVTIPGSVTSIGSDAFEGCTGLTSAGPRGGGYACEFGWTEKIPDYALAFCTGLTSVTIPNGVTGIGNHAFHGCTGLKSVTIPASVTSIGYTAFEDCTGLTDVYYGGSEAQWDTISIDVRNSELINANIQYNSAVPDTPPSGEFNITNGVLTEYTGAGGAVTIPNSVTGIGSSAFKGCTDLTSVTIPGGVTGIGDGAFRGCTGLNGIQVAASNQNYAAVDGVLFTKDKTTLHTYPGGKQGAYTVPDGVTGIGNYAFEDCTGLKSVTIPGSVTGIGYSAFYGCTGLTDVYYSGSEAQWSAVSIGNYNTPLTSANIQYSHSGPDTPPSGEFTIKNGVLTEYTGAGGAVTIPGSVTSIGSSAFQGCKGLTSVTIPSSVTSIGTWAFDGCISLTNVTTAGSVTSIENYAFWGCTSLKSAPIPDSVTRIGRHAFMGCTGLTSVTIPGSVTSISDGVFNGCTGLTGIQVAAGNQKYAAVDGVLFTKDKTTLHTYPGGKQGAYTVPDGVTGIGSYAFEDCTGLTGVTIAGSVTGIKSYAFDGCTGLTSVTIPGSVTSIGGGAFRDCTGLTGIQVEVGNQKYAAVDGVLFTKDPATLHTYPGGKQGAYTVPNGITSIGSSAFKGCTGLTSVTIPGSVTGIGFSAFDDCTGLTDVYYGGSEAQWSAVSIDSFNTPLTSANINCNSAAASGPLNNLDVSKDGNTYRVTGTLPEAKRGMVVCCAAYSASGQLLQIACQEFEASAQKQPVSFSVHTSESDNHLKLFFLDAQNLAPVDETVLIMP